MSRLTDMAPTDLDAYGLEQFEKLRCLALIELGRRAGSSTAAPAKRTKSKPRLMMPALVP